VNTSLADLTYPVLTLIGITSSSIIAGTFYVNMVASLFAGLGV
jgi:hypothetical protein